MKIAFITFYILYFYTSRRQVFSMADSGNDVYET